MKSVKNLWISGYRSYELKIFQDQDPKKQIIEKYLLQVLEEYCDQGLQWILTGGQLGIEQYAVTVAKKPQLQAYNLQVALMTPFKNMSQHWSEKNQQHLIQAIQAADYHQSVSNQNYLNPRQFTNWQQFMLQHTDSSLLVYDLEFPGKCQYEYQAIRRYQRQHDYELRLISFYDLQEFADSQREF
ncbi:Uncharacterized protein JG29_07560 [Bombilactobacillus mellis]|uniref:Uncharacterized protein n=1 Tax=Bombilactobacillus mellis TaxID=1218508 RepID=A0A0F4KUR4_9LACO|nr:SLOG family protein [Bombilactobacillus mellis]KJY48936.1 Uncharacterized protein JG29_07560 [Bombilactobacillus mellis]